MNTIRNKLTGLLLLFTFAAPLFIAYSAIQYKKILTKNEIKHRITAGINKEELTLLKFSVYEKETKLKWEHAEEFEYNRQMYDVVDSEIKGDSIYYWCLPDDEETELNEKLNRLVAKACGNDEKNNETQKRLYDFYKTLFHSSIDLYFSTGKCGSHNLLRQNNNLSSVTFPPPTPPPRAG